MVKLQQLTSAMRKLRMEIEFSAKQFGELADVIAVASMIIDAQGTVRGANCRAATMLGLKIEDLAGKPLHLFVAEGGEAMKRILSSGEAGYLSQPFELVLRGRSGRRSTVCVAPQAIEDAGDEERMTLLVLNEKGGVQTLQQTVQRSEQELARFTNRLIAAHDGELKRVSSELHDSIGQVLAMVKFMVEDASRHVQRGQCNDGREILDETVQRLREAISEVRRISRELRPSSLDDLGLLPTLMEHCRNYQNAYRHIALQLDIGVTESDVPSNLKSEIFRVVQEALNNIAKHSNASAASALLQADSQCLCLRVADNGEGFDVEGAGKGAPFAAGIGLQSMRDRVEATGGRFAIDSSAERGTTVEACWLLGDMQFAQEEALHA